MTLLPLMLSSPEKFDLNPSWIGAAFALQSITSVVCTLPFVSLSLSVSQTLFRQINQYNESYSHNN